MAKHGLGRGLDALIPPDNEVPSPAVSVDEMSGNEVPPSSDSQSSSVPQGSADPQSSSDPPKGAQGEVLIPLDKLKANPTQPRKHFDEEALQELADSIREHGIIQPIIAEDAGDGTYTIVAGERRTRAARLAGLTEAPVILRDYSEEKRMEVSLIENVQRADLNPIEEAAAYKQLMDLTGLSQDAVAAKVGKNRTTVANALRLLRLSPEMRQALEERALSPGHARAILSVTGKAGQDALFREILKKGLSVREAEKQAAVLNEKQTEKTSSVPKAPEKRAPEIGAMEEKFIDKLGTKVAIEGDLNKGIIRIEYFSMEDLERLYEILGS